MSAIWGVIDINENQISENYVTAFRKAYDVCRIDHSESICFENGVIGCELQYFREIAKKEKLPIREKGVYFTADVWLDNREELLSDPIFSNVENKEVPDGEILFRLYKTYGYSCLERIYGAYAFVYYNKEEQYIDIVMDHTGNRCLYYSFVDGALTFSTLMKPIYEADKSKYTLNDKMLAEYLAWPDYNVYADCEATTINEIKHAVAGEVRRVSLHGEKRINFWNPISCVGKLKGKSDEEYKLLLIQNFEKCVCETIQTEGEVGVLLSGGLDSSSVACFTAAELKKKNKMMFAYTMVPKEGYINDTGENVNVDERELVHKTAVFLGNVVEHYDSYETMNVWNVMEEQLSFLEGPYKSLQNVMWIKHLIEVAAQDGCKVVLSGGYGNDTISYGSSSTYIWELFIGGKWIRLHKELNATNGVMKYNKKKVLKSYWKALKSNRESIYNLKNFYKQDCLVNADMLRSMKLDKYCIKMQRKGNSIKTRKKYLAFVTDKIRFRQVGDATTKMSLCTGVLRKDPTMDPRVIEFCYSLPTEQFNKGCCPRRLIYEYFKDYLPKDLLQPNLPRGRQSADVGRRLHNSWEEIYAEMTADFSERNDIIDVEKAQQILECCKEKQELTDIERFYEMESLFFADQVIRIQKNF